MQHPRFALRAVRKRGKSIAALTLRRDMLGRFFCRILPIVAVSFAAQGAAGGPALDNANVARIERA
jgi:hypothetical protein